MFEFVHIGLDLFLLVDHLAVEVGDASVAQNRGVSLRSGEVRFVFAPAVVLLTAERVERRSVRVLEDHRGGVVNVAVFRLFDALHATAEREAGGRRNVAHRPEALVERVDVLAEHEVAGAAREVVPVADLVHQFRVALLTRTRPKFPGEVIQARRRNLADGAVQDALHHILDVQVVTPAEPGNER